MPPRLVPRPLVLALAAVLHGCGDGATEPRRLAGRYTLRASNGAGLPAPVAAGSAAVITGGVLDVVRPDSLVVTLAASDVLRLLVYTYRRAGDSLVVPQPAGSGGRARGDTVRLRLALPLPPGAGTERVWHDLLFTR